MKTTDYKHPKELVILAFSEMCERFTFWGVGNLLVLYMIQHYHSSGKEASMYYGTFAGFAAFLPIVGGFFADRWNYTQPLIWGAIVNALGCFLIAVGSKSLLILALFLMAVGYGLFTPSILTLLSYSYTHKPKLREAGFSIYYASINVGVFLAMVSLGYVAKTFDWFYAFLLAGVVQLIGLIPIFIYVKKHHILYKDLHPKKTTSKKRAFTKIEKDRIKVVLTLTLFSLLFWLPYIQGFSSMSEFALKYTDRWIGNYQFPTSWILSTESFFLIILAPILAKLYARMQKKDRDFSPTMKTSLSLFSMCICFIIMMIASVTIATNAVSANISFIFPIVAYFFMAVGEMLLAPIGLSLVTHLSPKRCTASMVGLWYVVVGASFYIGGRMAGLMQDLSRIFDFFSIFAIMTIIPAIVLLFLVKKLTKMSHKHHLESEVSPKP